MQRPYWTPLSVGFGLHGKVQEQTPHGYCGQSVCGYELIKGRNTIFARIAFSFAKSHSINLKKKNNIKKNNIKKKIKP